MEDTQAKTVVPKALGPEHTRRMQAVRGLSMEKWLCWGSIGVAGVLGLLFLLDFFIGRSLGFPFFCLGIARQISDFPLNS